MFKNGIYSILLLLSFTTLLSSCQQDYDDTSWQLENVDARLEATLNKASDGKGLDAFLLPDSDDFNKIPQDPKNPITAEKVKLGKLLFHETALGINPKNPEGEGTYSCASCHHAQGGFQACLPQGFGDGGVGFGHSGELRTTNNNYKAVDVDVQPLRTPSALNIAYQKNVLWNGQFGATGLNTGTESQWTEDTPIATNHLGYEGTEIQAIAGLTVHRMDINEAFLTNNPQYTNLFDAAFPSFPEGKKISIETAGLAIAAYERTLLANKAPFQAWLRGDQSAMSETEKLGALLFFTKGKCVTCHNGPALNAMEFHAIGVKDLHEAAGEILNVDPNDKAHWGRASFTGKTADKYKFKVPQLYNLKDSPFYGHGASFRSVAEVIEYKNEGVKENSNVPKAKLSEDFEPLGLSDIQVDQITAFIETGLHDPSLSRFVPESVFSGNCFPNNDTTSKADLGCD